MLSLTVRRKSSVRRRTSRSAIAVIGPHQFGGLLAQEHVGVQRWLTGCGQPAGKPHGHHRRRFVRHIGPACGSHGLCEGRTRRRWGLGGHPVRSWAQAWEHASSALCPGHALVLASFDDHSSTLSPRCGGVVEASAVLYGGQLLILRSASAPRSERPGSRGDCGRHEVSRFRRVPSVMGSRPRQGGAPRMTVRNMLLDVRRLGLRICIFAAQ